MIKAERTLKRLKGKQNDLKSLRSDLQADNM